tara:strand:- start:4804 stop:5229 length:426 start_codon:yes stop_codon:yes gene_type:complete
MFSDTKSSYTSYTDNQLKQYVNKYKLDEQLFNILKLYITRNYWKTKVNMESLFTLILNNGKLGIDIEQGEMLYNYGCSIEKNKDDLYKFSHLIGGLILDYWNIDKEIFGDIIYSNYGSENKKPIEKIKQTKLQDKYGGIWY